MVTKKSEEGVIQKVIRLIDEINKIHKIFSVDYFGSHEKENLKQTISHINIKNIYKYRLNLHESINDYLYDSKEIISYLYRVKTSEFIADKIERFRDLPIPLNSWLNDIFGCRIIVEKQVVEALLADIDALKLEHELQNYVIHPKQMNEEYRAIHLYFKNKDNGYFPWELQIWDKNDAENNIKNHKMYKRGFMK